MNGNFRDFRNGSVTSVGVAKTVVDCSNGVIYKDDKVYHFGMSLVLLPPLLKSEQLIDLFPNLSEEEIRQIKSITDLIDERILTPIIEAKDKESAIEEKLEQYNFYLEQAFAPILNKVIELRKSPEYLFNVCEYLRREVKENVGGHYTTRMMLFSVINILDEHDRYISKLLHDFNKLSSLFESVGLKEYLHAYLTTSVALSAVMLAISRKPEVVRVLSIIAKKHADELEPFVANFQISIEPELVSLREKTSEEDLEKAKELRGSILDL